MKTGLFLLFLFICNGLNGQKEDSLYQVLATVDTRGDSIELLERIGNIQLRYNLSKALETDQLALDLAMSLGDAKIIGDMKYSYSLILFMLERNIEAREMIVEILPHFKSRANDYKYGILLNRIAKISMDLAEFEKAEQELKDAQVILSSPNNINKFAIAYNWLWMSDLYMYTGRYEESLLYANRSYAHFEKASRFDEMSAAKVNMANIQLILGDYAEARYLLDEVLADRSKIVNQQFIVRPINLMAILEFEEGNIPKSIELFREVENIIAELGNFPDLSTTYLYLSKIYISSGDSDLAVHYGLRSLAEAKKSNIKRLEITANLQLAVVYDKLGQKDRSEKLIRSSYDWAKIKKDRELLIESAGLMATCADRIGDHKNAYKFKSEQLEESKKLLDQKKSKQIALQQLSFEIENDRREQEVKQALSDLNYQYQIEKAGTRQKGLIAVLSFVFLSALFLFLNNLQRKNKNKVLSQKNEALIEAEQTLATKNSELEKYIESNIQLQQFAHIASHDLKSPIRTITSFLGLLKRNIYDSLDSSNKSYIDLSIDSSKDMFALVNDLLSYSEVNSLSLNIAPFSMNCLLDNVIRNLDSTITEKQAVVNLKGIPAEIMGDDLKLRQVFQNLVANSLKFVDKDVKPEVEISCKESQEHWCFSIADNGIGIDKEYAERIFEPFVQLNGKKLFAGTGLGLSLCRKLIEKHHGTIWLNNEYEKGSMICFTISKTLSATGSAELV